LALNPASWNLLASTERSGKKNNSVAIEVSGVGAERAAAKSVARSPEVAIVAGQIAFSTVPRTRDKRMRNNTQYQNSLLEALPRKFTKFLKPDLTESAKFIR
jgi:hypothetical protein